MILLSVAFILALGTADPAPRCWGGSDTTGTPTIICAEKWCTAECRIDPMTRRPFFESPSFRPDFRERVGVPKRKLFRPKKDVTE